MKTKIVIFTLCAVVCKYSVSALSFPGPQVYVVTPSTRISKKVEGKPMPFYYHNWMRRMDTGPHSSTTTTTETSAPKVKKTPDLIFAEFESDGSKQKSIRKLLENERITTMKSTMRPIYVPDEEADEATRTVNYGLPLKTVSYNESSTENNKYSYESHEGYYSNIPAPMYVTVPPQTTITTTITPSPINTLPVNHDSIQNIWHVIDSQKTDQYSNNWEEISVNSTDGNLANENVDKKNLYPDKDSSKQEYDDGDVTIDDNFALPGFATNPGNGAENESRAIRNEQNIRFPYINLKPFQVKLSKKPLVNNMLNGKKTNLYTNLDNFYELKNPVRGEAQDVAPSPVPIDRYNPAQPYLPQQKYGSNLSKQSNPSKATASLVPPPPPPPTGNDFPSPTSYESFPPYAPSASDFGPAPASAPQPAPPISASILPSKSISSGFEISGPSSSDDDSMMDTSYRYKAPSENNNGAPMMNTGYHYKPPSVPTPNFYPTPATPSKPFQGYLYNKPSMTADTSAIADKPEFQGYHYSKPVYQKPPPDSMPPSYGYPPTDEHDSFPTDSDEHDASPPDVYNHDDTLPHIVEHGDKPPHSHGSDDDITYDKPFDFVKGGDDMTGYDMGMKPPALQTDVKPGSYGSPPNDHGFPNDFPTDFKFPPDLDDHYHDHEHEHYHIVEHPTTTTETPRVNRFSYYYLGKKLYYLPLYFSVYFIIYVGALIIKAVLRHKIVYPNSWRPNTTTATFFSKRSVDEYLSHENLHGLTRKVTNAIASAAEKYMDRKNKLS